MCLSLNKLQYCCLLKDSHNTLFCDTPGETITLKILIESIAHYSFDHQVASLMKNSDLKVHNFLVFGL